MADPAAQTPDLQQKYRQFLDLLPLTITLAGLPPSEGRLFSEEQIEAAASRSRRLIALPARSRRNAWADRKTVAGRVSRRERFSAAVLFGSEENPIRQSRDEHGRRARSRTGRCSPCPSSRHPTRERPTAR